MIATTEVVSGKPAKNIDILNGISPAPVYKLLPATISYTNALSKPTVSVTAFKTGANN